MATDNRKRAIRERMATTGEPYSRAALAIDQAHGADPTATVIWALLSITAEAPSTTHESDQVRRARYHNAQQAGRPERHHRGIADFERIDVEHLALGAATAYRRPTPSPVVTLAPIPNDALEDELLFLIRLRFDAPGREVDWDRIASSAAHALLQRDRRLVVAARWVAPWVDPQALLAAAKDTVDSPPIAERDWHTHALVRLVCDVAADSPDGGPRHYATGRVLDLWQTGRAGEPVDRNSWRNSYDVDLMHFFPTDAVEVLEVLEEMPPMLADPVETAAQRYARRWKQMPPLFAAAHADPAMTEADWALLHDHRADLTRELSSLLRRLRQDQAHPEASLLRTAAEVIETVVTAETAPWGVQEARMTSAELRALAEQLPDVDEAAVSVCLVRAEPTLTEAVRADGMVSLDARLTPAQRQAAEPRLADRIIAAAPGGRERLSR
uniref:hypothetical protein n=1 Tax=Streptosporangium sp. CA-256172 TaxID=3240076 RepID=UPI003F49199C